jgi:hypothetical protein
VGLGGTSWDTVAVGVIFQRFFFILTLTLLPGP